MNAPPMTQKHRKNKVKWVLKHINQGEEFWNFTLFSYKKKFSLVKKDGLDYCWHDLRTKEKYFLKGKKQEVSVMRYGAISIYKGSQIAFIDDWKDYWK